MKKSLRVLLVVGMLVGTPKPASCSVYSRVKGCGDATKDWVVKYACVTGNKTVECFNVSKDWTIRYGGAATDWTVKHSIIVKNGIVYYANNETFCDMLYLTADGFTFGLILDDERCKDIIGRHPISGRIVWISSRVVAVVIISKGVEKIVYYVIRHFATGGVYTSQGIDGAVNYVGRTNNFARRGTEWLRGGRIITPVYRTPFLCEQRALEQTLINRYGLTNLANKIHSISP